MADDHGRHAGRLHRRAVQHAADRPLHRRLHDRRLRRRPASSTPTSGSTATPACTSSTARRSRPTSASTRRSRSPPRPSGRWRSGPTGASRPAAGAGRGVPADRPGRAGVPRRPRGARRAAAADRRGELTGPETDRPPWVAGRPITSPRHSPADPGVFAGTNRPRNDPGPDRGGRGSGPGESTCRGLV